MKIDCDHCHLVNMPNRKRERKIGGQKMGGNEKKQRCGLINKPPAVKKTFTSRKKEENVPNDGNNFHKTNSCDVRPRYGLGVISKLGGNILVRSAERQFMKVDNKVPNAVVEICTGVQMDTYVSRACGPCTVITLLNEKKQLVVEIFEADNELTEFILTCKDKIYFLDSYTVQVPRKFEIIYTHNESVKNLEQLILNAQRQCEIMTKEIDHYPSSKQQADGID